jgi:hypothetical protein
MSIVHLPEGDSTVAHANDFAHALSLHAKRRMAKETTNVFSSLLTSDVKMDQAIPGVT